MSQIISAGPIAVRRIQIADIWLLIHKSRRSTGIHIFYADDLQIYIQVPFDRVHEGLFQLKNAAQQVAAWADQLSLKLGAGKTQAIFFGSSGYVQRLRAMNLPGVSLQPETMVPFDRKLIQSQKK